MERITKCYILLMLYAGIFRFVENYCDIFFLFIYRNIFLQFDKYHGQWIEAEAEVPSVCRLNQDFRESELGYSWESVQLS